MLWLCGQAQRGRTPRFDADGIRRVGYENTEHFGVMREFMANPRQMLDRLLPD